LLEIPKYVPVEPAIDYANSENVGAGNEEYDPTQNWEMDKKKKKAKVLYLYYLFSINMICLRFITKMEYSM